MGKSSRLARIWHRHERSFLKSLHHAKGLQAREVHRLRVDVKNLRVLLLLQYALSGNRKTGKRLRRLVAPVFRHAGDMRSATLNLQLIKGFQLPVITKFRRTLRQQKSDASKALVEAIDAFDADKFGRLNKRVATNLKKRKNKTIRRETAEYLRVLFAEVRADLFDTHDDETLHEIRKKLKIVKNLGALLTELDEDHPFAEDLEQINTTYETLGKWHDIAVLLEQLEQYLKDLNNPASALNAAPLMRDLRRQCSRHRMDVEKKLKADLVW